MSVCDEIKYSIEAANSLLYEGLTSGENDEYWLNLGAKLLIVIDRLCRRPELANSLTPEDYSRKNVCLLDLIFKTLPMIRDVNGPFGEDAWINRHEACADLADGDDISSEPNSMSFYELSLSRCCTLICQLLADHFVYVQKLLIKNLFSSSYVQSMFASDIYMFIMRIIDPRQKASMVMLIMNFCRLAPPEAIVRGAALINRAKHPTINFQNNKFHHILDTLS